MYFSFRIDGVQLGGEDFTKELEIPRILEGQELFYARKQLVTAARARGIDLLCKCCRKLPNA